MALSPDPRRRDTRTAQSGDQPQDPAPLGAMQEPLDPLDRPVPRTSDDNEVNLGSTYTTSARPGSSSAREVERNRGFTTTFAIIAAVLVAAFLVALYLGSDRANLARAPTATEPPMADTSPGTTNDTTGSTTTPAQPQQGSGTGGNSTQGE